MRVTAPLVIVAIFLMFAFPADPPRAGAAVSDDFFIRGEDISALVKTFMRCNGDGLFRDQCEALPAADGFLFSAETAAELGSYHFVLIPGGDYDFFDELLGTCDGEPSENFQDFATQNPGVAREMSDFVDREICPDYDQDPDHLYNEFMGAYLSYLELMRRHAIPVTRVDFNSEVTTQYVGDRVHKLDLLARTIDQLEADNSSAGENRYVLIGHSFGGINACDFLVELLQGHDNATPEGRAFADTEVRRWSADKKQSIFARIKGAVFINTFVQGDKSSETQMQNIADDEGRDSDDPVGDYIRQVIGTYPAGTYPAGPPWDKILHFVLRSNRYRVQYYLQDRNRVDGSTATTVQRAFDTIADNLAIVSIGCIVPRFLPDMRVGDNFIVNKSKSKYRRENNERNDGLVDTYGAFFPRESVEYATIRNVDHGTLVLKPQVPGITTGHVYDQEPFIKTLLARLAWRLRADE